MKPNPEPVSPDSARAGRACPAAFRCGSEAGFTLVEALIAVTLGAILIGLVVSVVIAQGGYYQGVMERTGLEGTVRSVADLVREELQAVTRSGIVTAEGDHIEFRVPLSMGVVCGSEPHEEGGGGKGGGPPGGVGKASDDLSVYLPLPPGGIDGGRVSGWGRREAGDDWAYVEASWEDMQNGGLDPLDICASFGADTVGTQAEFRSLTLSASKGPPGQTTAGDVIALFSEVEYLFADSQLRPGARALFRREADGPLVELATGLGEESGFAYRRPGTGFQASPPGGQVGEIVEVQVTVVAQGPERVYERQLRIPLRNAP